MSPHGAQVWSHRVLPEAGWSRTRVVGEGPAGPLGSPLAGPGPPHGGVRSQGEHEARLDPSSEWSTLLPLPSSTTSILPPS